MSDTPTPRTDALMEQWDYSPAVSVLIKHASQLERELAEARKIGQEWALAAQRCGLFRSDIPHSTPEEWQAAQLSATTSRLDELVNCKAALEKCEKALFATWADLDHLNHWMPTPCRELYMEALSEIAKLKGNK